MTDVQALTEALTSAFSAATAAIPPPPAGGTPAATHISSFKAPDFWDEDPEMWFSILEAKFRDNYPAITRDSTKYDKVLVALKPTHIAEVKATIRRLDASAATDKYDQLKAALMKAFAKTDAEKEADLLAINGLGDRKPTALLRHMRSLATDPERVFRAFYLSQLPVDVRKILAASPNSGDIEKLAEEADKVVEQTRLAGNTSGAYHVSAAWQATPPPPPPAAWQAPTPQAAYPPPQTQLLPPAGAHDASAPEVYAARGGPPQTGYQRPRPKGQQQSTGNSGPSSKYTLCRFHARWGPEARNCQGTVDGIACGMGTKVPPGNGAGAGKK